MGWDTDKRTIFCCWLPGDAAFVIDRSLRCHFFFFFPPSIRPPEIWPTTRKTTWKLKRRGKSFWSRLLNIPGLLNRHTAQVTEGPRLLSWKARFACGAPSCQAMAPQKNQCLSTPIGASPSKSIFFPAFRQHLLIFQQLTPVSFSILTSGMKLKWLRSSPNSGHRNQILCFAEGDNCAFVMDVDWCILLANRYRFFLLYVVRTGSGELPILCLVKRFF